MELATDILRLNCDFMSFLFACDEYTDLLGKEEAQSVSDSLLDALQNPFLPRLEGQPVVIEMARQSVMYSTSRGSTSLVTLFGLTIKDFTACRKCHRARCTFHTAFPCRVQELYYQCGPRGG